MKTLVYIHSLELLQVSWIILNDQNSIINSTTYTDLNSLSAAAKSNEIEIIIPAHYTLITQVAMPKMNRYRLLQALPFALEEQLLDDVNELHFAIGDYQTNGHVPVAIIQRKILQTLLEQLGLVGIQPTKIIPSLFTLPVTENNWHIQIINQDCAVRTNTWNGFSCDRENLATVISATTHTTTPECIYAYVTPADQPISIDSANNLQINFFDLPQLLHKTAETLRHYPVINLLQGSFQPKHQAIKAKNMWKYACYAIMACFVISLFSNAISSLILHYKLNKVDAAIMAIYQRNFPNTTALTAPRERMEAKLHALQEQTNNNLFLSMLAIAGNQLKQSSTIHLKSLEFRNKALNLTVTATTFDALDNFIKSIKAKGLDAKEENAAISDNQVNSNIIILQRGNA